MIRAGVLGQDPRAWSAGPNLEDFHHGEEKEEDEGTEVICRYRRPSFKTRGEFDRVADAASARRLPKRGRPRAGPFACVPSMIDSLEV